MNNDLISRSALKKQFANECLHNCYYCKLSRWDKEGACYNCGLIDNAPTVDIPDLSEYEGIANALNMASELLHKKRTQGEWIPVSELPEKTGYYLVTRKGFSIKNHVKRAGYDASTKRWSEGSIIAWQPLPEPYKEGGAEE